MHIARHGRGSARYLHARILTIAAAALIAMPALAAGPVGPTGPVGPPSVAPAKPPSIPSAPAVAPTTPVIPQAPAVIPSIPSPVTALPGAPIGTAKIASPADETNSALKDVSTTPALPAPGNGTPNAFTATVSPTTSGGGVPSGIADQANAGTLTSYLRIPDTQLTPGTLRSTERIPGVDVIVKKNPGGNSLQLKTDGKGNASLGKLMRGASYDIVISGKDLEPALDRIASGKTGGGTAQPQKIIGVLVALLLPAVQKVGTIPSGPYSRVFARGSKDQAIHLSLALAKDGTATINWGDGGGNVPLGNIKDGTALSISFTAPGNPTDVTNSSTQDIPQTRIGSLAGTGTVTNSSAARGIANVGVTARGHGGTFQGLTDRQGSTWLPKLPIGNTVFDFNAKHIASSLTTAVTPTHPTPQQEYEFLVVIFILTGWLPTDEHPVVFASSWPASALPSTLRSDLQVGKDGNAVIVNRGTGTSGPQAPQSLTKIGAGALILSGSNTYTGSTTVNSGLAKTVQDVAGQGKAGEVGVLIVGYNPGSSGGTR